MIIYMSRFLLVLTALMLTVSCGRNNIVSGVPVRYVTAERSMELKADSSFRYDFPRSLQCVDLTIANDSILVLRETVGSSDSLKFFGCYSLRDYSWLGDYVVKGRGPGEALNPFIRGMLRAADGRECCYVGDAMLGRVYELDLPLSIERGGTVIRELHGVPANTVYNYPYRDSLRFLVRIGDEDRMLYEVVTADNEVRRSFNLYRSVSAENCLSQISHCTVVNQRAGLAALLMLGLPQMNILDLESGEVRSFAVDREYRRWRDIIERYDGDSGLYYNYATATEDVILATYAGKSVMEFANDRNVHIHVFDWSGSFLYDITVRENVNAMAFDELGGMLYALDRTDNRIYRYDLSELI